MLKSLHFNVKEFLYFKLIHNLTVLFFEDHLQSCTKIRKQIEDKGLPAPPRGSSEELQRSNYLQIQKCFTLALLVLLVANIISGMNIVKNVPIVCLPASMLPMHLPQMKAIHRHSIDSLLTLQNCPSV